MHADVLMRNAPDARAGGQVDTVRRAARSMDRLIRDLLDLASLEAGRLRSSPRARDAGQPVSEAVELLQPPPSEREPAPA